MSSITSSIWHTKKENPTEDKTIFAQHKSYRDGCIDCFLWEKQEFTEAIRKDVIAWCYLDDLVALETELERTRKALDVAVDALKSVKRYLCEMPAPDGATALRMACESATAVKKALDQITALEQKE